MAAFDALSMSLDEETLSAIAADSGLEKKMAAKRIESFLNQVSDKPELKDLIGKYAPMLNAFGKPPALFFVFYNDKIEELRDAVHRLSYRELTALCPMETLIESKILGRDDWRKIQDELNGELENVASLQEFINTFGEAALHFLPHSARLDYLLVQSADEFLFGSKAAIAKKYQLVSDALDASIKDYRLKIKQADSDKKAKIKDERMKRKRELVKRRREIDQARENIEFDIDEVTARIKEFDRVEKLIQIDLRTLRKQTDDIYKLIEWYRSLGKKEKIADLEAEIAAIKPKIQPDIDFFEYDLSRLRRDRSEASAYRKHLGEVKAKIEKADRELKADEKRNLSMMADMSAIEKAYKTECERLFAAFKNSVTEKDRALQTSP